MSSRSIGLLSKQFGKGFLIRSQKICHPSQLRHYHLLNGVCSDIVSATTFSSVICLVVGTYEIVNVLVDRVRMMTEFTVTIAAEQQIAEYAFLAVFGFGARRLVLAMSGYPEHRNDRRSKAKPKGLPPAMRRQQALSAA